MSLPYRWHPSGTRATRDPNSGMLWPFEHAVYRIIEVNPIPEVDWTDNEREYVEGTIPTKRHVVVPRHIVVRPAHLTSGDVRDRDRDRHFRFGGRYMSLDIYPNEHYPICAQCHEPLPCREQMAERVAEQASATMQRYDTAGICPACSEPVTHRQASLTFSENLESPVGPPVTFHLRSRCHHSAVRYEKRWVAADPENRKAQLSCPGHVTNHNDGTYECSALAECPGPTTEHPSHTVCCCPDCHARGSFGCFPSPTARNQALDGAS